MMARLSTFATMADSVEVIACWAPTTSLSRRATSEPVCARVKNAMGCRCTWSNTSVRRS